MEMSQKIMLQQSYSYRVRLFTGPILKFLEIMNHLQICKYV